MSSKPCSRRLRSVAVLAMSAAVAATFTVVSPSGADGPSIAALTFADEFNGPAGSRVDGSKWLTETGDNVVLALAREA